MCIKDEQKDGKTIEATRVSNETESMPDVKLYKVNATPHGGDNDDPAFLEIIVNLSIIEQW